MRVALGLLALLLLAPGSGGAQETPRMGGVLKVATIGEPPTLDIPMSTAVITYEIMWHVNEALFTYDAGFNPVPLLADTHAVTEGGRRQTITLRKGVKFHNGKEMTAADVVPSLKRWGQVASLGKSLWANVESIEDVTYNLPRLGWIGKVHCHHGTGDWIFSGGNGTYIYPAPYDWSPSAPASMAYHRALWGAARPAIPNRWEEL